MEDEKEFGSSHADDEEECGTLIPHFTDEGGVGDQEIIEEVVVYSQNE